MYKKGKHTIMRLVKTIIFFLMISLPAISHAASATVYETAYLEYPQSMYIVGIAEVPKTDNTANDQRLAEILARLDIAKQIKIQARITTIRLRNIL